MAILISGDFHNNSNKIIAAYAGTGKTTLAIKHPDIFVDFVSMPYKYIIENDSFEAEKCKANPDYDMNIEWPLNYVEAIVNYPDKSKILLIPPDRFVLTLLHHKRINYYICYPEESAKEEYHKRFINRGNTEEFIDIFIGRWDNFLQSFQEDNYGNHLILKQDEYLEDVIMNSCVFKNACVRTNNN